MSIRKRVLDRVAVDTYVKMRMKGWGEGVGDAGGSASGALERSGAVHMRSMRGFY
jgi:hypothetical protein